MNYNIGKMLTELIQRDIGYGIVNNSNLNDLDIIDKRIRKRIRKQFGPEIPLKSKYSKDEYFEVVIKNLARQILIAEEIENEIQNIGHTPDKDTKILVKNLRQVCVLLERES